MNSIIPWAMFCAAGITFFSSLKYIVVAQDQKNDKLYLLFSICALLITGMIISRALVYDANSSTSLVFLRKVEVLFICSFGIAFLEFVSYYTQFRARKWMLILHSLSAVLILANFILPFGIHYFEPPPLTYIELPWGALIPDLRAINKTPTNLLWLYITLSLVYAFIAALHFHKNVHKTQSVNLLFAIGLFAFLCLFNIPINFQLITFPHTSDFGFVFLILMMDRELSTSWRNDKIRFNNILNALPVGLAIQNSFGLDYIFTNATFKRRGF